MYIYPKLVVLINKQLEKEKSMKGDGKHSGLKVTSMKALALICLLLFSAFVVFHILSAVEYIQYGNEVLYNQDFNDGSTYDDHQTIPIFHAVFSLIPTAIVLFYGMFVFSIWIFLRIESSRKLEINDNDINSISRISDTGEECVQAPVPVTATGLLSINIVYIGSYFMPYMLLAFIHDPLQTSFTYLIVTAFIICAY